MDGTLDIAIVHLWNRNRPGNFQLDNYHENCLFALEYNCWGSNLSLNHYLDIFLFYRCTYFHLCGVASVLSISQEVLSLAMRSQSSLFYAMEVY